MKFYADREHYHFESGNWDTVSGEPLNILWCGEEPDFIEDGTVARNALSASAEPSAPCITPIGQGCPGDGVSGCKACPQAPAEIDERAGFEAYALDKGWLSQHLKQRPDGNYEDWGVNPEWQAWKARAALERKPITEIPEGYCVMPRSLTAKNGAKALLLGEFKLQVTRECPECAELEEPAEGCEICDGAGEYGQSHMIPWDQIKFIYSEAVKGLALKQ